MKKLFLFCVVSLVFLLSAYTQENKDPFVLQGLIVTTNVMSDKSFGIGYNVFIAPPEDKNDGVTFGLNNSIIFEKLLIDNFQIRTQTLLSYFFFAEAGITTTTRFIENKNIVFGIAPTVTLAFPLFVISPWFLGLSYKYNFFNNSSYNCNEISINCTFNYVKEK